ncbi:MAG: helix-turn-helix domain-containing protein [Bacteroidetes bacterium]|nr:helix-turn-helix domain-containing protein [Bacteroidota bacterium]
MEPQPEYKDNPQLRLALEFVQCTDRNIFLTGKAGTGKTTFLHNLKGISLKRMIVVAPTGVAAINAGGVTVHSFFQLPFGPIVPDMDQPENNTSGSSASRRLQDQIRFNRDKINIIRSLDLLVIDEISMVRADLLDGIDAVLRRFRDKSRPFGGVQLLMIGDMRQLAPVVKDEDREILKNFYDSFFFFGSRALKKTQYVSIELQHVYRQSDMHFIRLLNKIRDNKMDTEALETLNKRYIPDFSPAENEGYITLTTHNAQALTINEAKLDKIKAKAAVFEATVYDDFPEYSYPADFLLTLKKGVQVMFVKNDPSRDKLFYNGKIGTVTGFGEDVIYVRCPGDYSDIPAVRTEWQNIKYTIDEDTKEITETVTGSFIQYPLKLAWAITIHKSQGLTFDKAIIDAYSAFASGQVYVAISRCRSFEGLVLSSRITARAVKSDGTISGFIREIEENPPGKDHLDESKSEYQRSLLFELFDFSILQKSLFYFRKMLDENVSALRPGAASVVGEVISAVKTELNDVWEKFRDQVNSLLQNNGMVEGNTQLQQRIAKACVYFADKTVIVVFEKLQNLTIETDNKAVQKAVTEVLERILLHTHIKIACFEACKNGFSHTAFLEARAKASLEIIKLRKKTEKRYEPAESGVVHKELYTRLKKWRNITAEELDLPVYGVLQIKTMEQLAGMLPVTLSELKEIKGLGKKRIKRFGRDIIAIIIEYRKEKNMEVPLTDLEEEEEAAEPQRRPKTDTKKVSFDLFRGGMSTKEIAKERSLAVTTIEGHLAHYVGTGEIDIRSVLDEAKFRRISEYFTSAGNIHLGQAKEMLGEDVSYGELKYVLAHLSRNHEE